MNQQIKIKSSTIPDFAGKTYVSISNDNILGIAFADDKPIPSTGDVTFVYVNGNVVIEWSEWIYLREVPGFISWNKYSPADLRKQTDVYSIR